jgi:proline dehydrogenase
MSVVRSLLLAGSQSDWLRRTATRRGFVRRAVTRFMPGESADDALRAAQELGGRGLGTILTHLGENLRDRSEAVAETEHYVDLARRIDAQRLDAEISIKLTQLGYDLDPELATAQALRVSAEAKTRGRLWVDMESSAYTEQTIAMYEKLRRTGAEVGLALQAYLHRTPDDIERLMPLAPAIRLVKGAYREPASLALQGRDEIRERFFELSKRLIDARELGAWFTAATHDTELIRRVESLATERKLTRGDFEFAMLYGIQTGEQERLARAGYRVRVLISYGAAWFPWYMRRLAEKPSNMLLVARSLVSTSHRVRSS